MRKFIIAKALLFLTIFTNSIQASNIYFGGAFGYSESAVTNMEGAPQIKAFAGQRLKYFDLEAGYSYDIEADMIHEYSSSIRAQSFVNSHTAYLHIKPKIPYYGGYIFGVLGASYSQASLNVKDFLDAEIEGDTTTYVREKMQNKGNAIYYDIGLGYEHIIPIPEVKSIKSVSVVFQYTYSILGYKDYNTNSTYVSNLEIEGVDPALPDALQNKSSLVVAFKVNL